MDCNVFMCWLGKRLWPTFKARFGEDMKMIMILDNAPYHHGMEDWWKRPLKMNKKEGAALLRELNIPRMSVTQKGKEIVFQAPREDGAFAIKPKGPTVPEVQEATFKAVKKESPQDLLTRAEKWSKESDAGYMLFTPLYCPDFQPVELFWGAAKNYVGRTFGGRGTMQDAVALLRPGWYGGLAIGEEGLKQPVDRKRSVDHSIRCVNKGIKRDDVLSGSIEGGLENVPNSYKVSRESGLDALETSDRVELLDVDVDEDDGESDHLSDLQDVSPGLEFDIPETCESVEFDEEGDIVMDESGS